MANHGRRAQREWASELVTLAQKAISAGVGDGDAPPPVWAHLSKAIATALDERGDRPVDAAIACLATLGDEHSADALATHARQLASRQHIARKGEDGVGHVEEAILLVVPVCLCGDEGFYAPAGPGEGLSGPQRLGAIERSFSDYGLVGDLARVTVMARWLREDQLPRSRAAWMAAHRQFLMSGGQEAALCPHQGDGEQDPMESGVVTRYVVVSLRACDPKESWCLIDAIEEAMDSDQEEARESAGRRCRDWSEACARLIGEAVPDASGVNVGWPSNPMDACELGAYIANTTKLDIAVAQSGAECAPQSASVSLALLLDRMQGDEIDIEIRGSDAITRMRWTHCEDVEQDRQLLEDLFRAEIGIPDVSVEWRGSYHRAQACNMAEWGSTNAAILADRGTIFLSEGPGGAHLIH